MHGEICAADGAGPLTGETLEDLQLRGLKVLQKRQGFRFGADAVLLADFAQCQGSATVVDLGTGTGILPLLLYGQGKGQVFHGFELVPEMACMAARTVRLNGLTAHIHIWNVPAEEAPAILAPNTCDLVVCNPPYGLPGATRPSADPAAALARHQGPEGLHGWFRAAYCILRGKGRMAVVYPATQLLSLTGALEKAGMAPKRLRLVHRDAASGASLVLVEAVKNARPGLSILPPLLLCESDGTPSAEAKRIYHQAE